jgi:peptidoglycan biosynthesis protein MviN/MurJ (putative lipid II flippase)
VKADLTRRIIIRRFRRRRLLAIGAVVVGLVGGLLLAWLIRPEAHYDPEAKWTSVHFEIVIFFLVAAAFVAFTTFRCPNCQKLPWGRGGVSLNPKRCGACKVRLEEE